MARGLVDVQHPTLAAIDPPFGAYIIDGLVGVASGHVDMSRVTCTAQGDVGELPAATVGEHVRCVNCCSLDPVHRQRVRMVEVVAIELVSDEDLVAAVASTDVVYESALRA